MTRFARRQAVLLGGLTGLLLVPTAPSDARGQGGLVVTPKYSAALLRCTVFAESVETEIRMAGPSGTSTEHTGRAGRLQVRALPATGGLDFEAWYDTLAVWRDGPDGRVVPDTDGLVGGRWRGSLGPTGAATLRAAPFMPPEVLPVADLAVVLTDFFPLLAPRTLAVGETWDDADGHQVTRRPDRDGAWIFEWRVDRARPLTTGAVGGERLHEVGQMAWREGTGPESWERQLTVDTEARRSLEAGSSLRSRVSQSITVTRVTESACQ